MTCLTSVDGAFIGFVCGENYAEIHRESVGERWCFECRKRTEYFYVVSAPVDPMSWYGPNPAYECGSCGKDGYCFPGTWIEWEEPGEREGKA